jgi:iron complex outermembrane receptor protein
MKRIQIALRAGAAVAALSVATSAAAQSTQPPEDVAEAQAAPTDEAAAGGDIVITGSRIRRDPLSQDSPIVFVDEDDIAKTGLNSINDVLQRLPSSGGGINSKFNNSGNLGNPPSGAGVGAGAAEIDLRYLQSNRTLVLVDGLRFVNAASASGVPPSIDLNAIPDSMIERVEVLQDGASAIYGSDAIAGVVNIITKRSQDGFAASAQLGSYLDEGDGFTQNYQLSWGNGDSGPLKLVVGGNYVKQEDVRAGDRDISLFPAPYSTTCADGGCSSFIPNGRYIILTNPALPPGPGNPFRDLTLINAPTATPTLANFRPFVSPADRFNFAPFNYFQIPLERYGAFANVQYEISDTVNFTAKGVLNQRKSKNQAAPLPFGIGPDAGITPVLDATTVHATNPFNPFGVTLDFTNMAFIFRRFVEGGPRRFSQKVTTGYGVATLDGRFSMMDRDWFWDVNGSYGRNKAEQTMHGNINSSHLRQALGPVAQCVGQPGQFGGTCTPFNFFGGAGSITPEMMDFVTFVQNDSSRQSLWDFTANLSGSMLDLPGGPLGVAMGVEYRRLSGRFDPDPVVAAGFSSDIPAGPTRGRISVKEAYAELNAPLLSERPFANLLELSAAVRLSDYSKSGATTTFKGGVNWKPIRDLRLRGSYAEGFRAPSIGELFGTLSRFDQTISDPCSNDSTAPRNFVNDHVVRNNCIAAGVPAGGTYEQANPQISVLVSGNEDLKPETSKSWIFGGVFSPSALRGFSVEANHYNIRIKSAIQAVDAAITLNNCVVSNDPAACALVTRSFSGSGQLTFINGTLGNIAGIKTKGIDLNLAYRSPTTRAGRFGVTWNNTFLTNYDLILTGFSGSQVISREGTEVGSPSQGFPKWKAIGILDWDLEQVGASVTGRYISKLRESDGNVLKSKLYTDLQLRWSPSFNMLDQLGIAIGANNLFNIRAPGCNTCDLNNFDPTMYDIPGRYYYARVSVKM